MEIKISMTDFEKCLYQHVNKYQDGIMPQFVYKDGTTLSPGIVEELSSQYKQFEILQEMWEKEKDYCRLLRKENLELQDELNYLYNNMEEASINNTDNENKEKTYLS